MRKLLVAFIAAFLSFAGIQAAHAADPFAVTASTTTPSIALGQSFVLKGGVYPVALGKNTVVRVQKFNGETWDTVQSPTTSANSYYSATIAPTAEGTSQWRTYKGASGGRAAAVSPTVEITTGPAQPFAVTASVNGNGGAEIPTGQNFTIGGGVYPATLGKNSVVRVQKFNGETWDTIQSPTTSANSYYSATIKATEGSSQYRVYKGASGGRAAAVSPTVNITGTPPQPFTVTASIDNWDAIIADAGERLPLVGGVYPKTPGKIVRVQQFVDYDEMDREIWQTIQSPTLSANGFYSATLTAPDYAAFYRVYKGASDGRGAAVSREILVGTEEFWADVEGESDVSRLGVEQSALLKMYQQIGEPRPDNG